jgi:multidrug efflux pump subunit AcrA (membrane-fusion protein)
MTLTKVEVDDSKEKSTVKTNRPKPLYACKQFPDVTSELPGECPMDGTPMVLVDQTVKQAEMIIAKVKLRKAQLKHFHPDVFPVTTMLMEKNVRLLGQVVQAEDRMSNITARVSGRIEKVFVESTGQLVKKGDRVVEIYSPKLITAGEEYLIAKRAFLKNKNKDNRDMLKQSERRLLEWGISKTQIDKWFKSGKVPNSIMVHSNETGIIKKRNAYVGKYFKEGQDYFKLTDLGKLWVEIDIYETDANIVSLGQSVKMHFSALPGIYFSSKIDFINPFLDIKTHTLKVRATLDNTDGKLRPGMVADVQLKIEIPKMRLVVPRSAVIDTGKRKVVWLQESKKKYKAVIVTTGIESDGYIEIVSGIKKGNPVVIEGNFLLDAQAQLFGGYQDMSKMPGHQH